MKRTALLRKTPLARKHPGTRSRTPKRTRDFEYLAKVRALGCCICGRDAEAHHIRSGYGTSQRASDLEAIPLCPKHHREGPEGVAFHAGPRRWQTIAGDELEHLQRTWKLLGITFQDLIRFRGGKYPPWAAKAEELGWDVEP